MYPMMIICMGKILWDSLMNGVDSNSCKSYYIGNTFDNVKLSYSEN